MSGTDLLDMVQPNGGWFAVVAIKGNRVRQELVETREEVDALVAQWVEQHFDVYFGVAKFKGDAGRTKDNVLALKAFWLDIDCGVSKAVVNDKTGRPNGYETQSDGLVALRHFCKVVGLPKPVLVNSGRGIHVYWPLTEEITREQWEPVAARLRDLCLTHDLYVDNAVFEVSRILRVPGTFNFKGDPPVEVEIINPSTQVSFEKFHSLLGMDKVVEKVLPPKRELTALAKSLLDNSYSSFSKIMKASAAGKGCGQLLSCYNDRASLSEPRWFDALSVAKFCRDADTAIHKLSKDHPDYDPEETEHKVKHILGPHTCAKFEENNPGGCAGCPYAGKIKSPIVLGKVIEESSPDDYIVEAQPEDPEESLEESTEDADETVAGYKIPTYPEPFFRGKNGGIYRRASDPEGEPMLVYPNDFYVVKRMNDPVLRDVILMRLHLPCDGVREFVFPNTKLGDKSELKKELLSWGVIGSDKQHNMLAEFVMASISTLQHKRKVELMRLQFGWADNDSKFIIGDREVSKDGVFHSPPSSVTRDIAAHLGPAGDYEKWKEVFNLYGRPGLEPHAFAALTAFGAPLFKFTGQRGAMLNIIHPRSGTGKTTVLHMCNSVWGSPDRLCAVKEDTLNAKIMRLGVYNNLPYTVDEMTNTTPQDFSTLAYNITQGRGKDRVRGSSNELRANFTTWQTMALCSSNASFYEKMAAAKASADGELMRLIEYKIDQSDAIDTTHAKEMFDHQLLRNYGHAGLVYAQWLVNNLEQAKKSVASIQRKLDNELQLTARERFWSSILAANITGGLIAKHLDIINWDVHKIYDWATEMLLDMRNDVEAPLLDVVEVIGDYINRNMQSILVVDDGLDRRSNMQMLPALEPRNELRIRYEPDSKRIFFAAKPFKNFCAEFQINYKETLKQLESRGVYIGTENKRLSKGMKVVSPPVHSLVFDCENPDFIKIDAILPAVGAVQEDSPPETADAGGGS